MAHELILVVEDDVKSMKLVRDILQAYGYRTLEAGSAEAALSLVATQKPDLVLMDIRLPGMSGIDALEKLRASPDTKRIPVLAFTASDRQERPVVAGARFDGFVSKPIRLKKFVASISEALGQSGAGG